MIYQNNKCVLRMMQGLVCSLFVTLHGAASQAGVKKDFERTSPRVAMGRGVLVTKKLTAHGALHPEMQPLRRSVSNEQARLQRELAAADADLDSLNAYRHYLLATNNSICKKNQFDQWSAITQRSNFTSQECLVYFDGTGNVKLLSSICNVQKKWTKAHKAYRAMVQSAARAID